MHFQSLQSSFIAAAPLCVVPLGSQAVPAQDQGQGQDPELLLGQEVFDGLKAQAEIIESSPLYDQLLPIADAITRAAQPRYNLPFKFYRVHGAQPNAFATPGGNVHVVDSLLYFRQEYVGTRRDLVSRSISYDPSRHDNVDGRAGTTERGGKSAQPSFWAPSAAHVLAIALLGKLHSLSYSRDVESCAPHHWFGRVCGHRGITLGDWCGCSRILSNAKAGRATPAFVGSPQQSKSDRCAGTALPEESSGL